MKFSSKYLVFWVLLFVFVFVMVCGVVLGLSVILACVSCWWFGILVLDCGFRVRFGFVRGHLLFLLGCGGFLPISRGCFSWGFSDNSFLSSSR